MTIRDISTSDALRDLRKSIRACRGIVIQVPDEGGCNPIKECLDLMLAENGFECSKSGIPVPEKDSGFMIYAKGAYPQEFLDSVEDYIKTTQGKLSVFEGKERDFDGIYWIKNIYSWR